MRSEIAYANSKGIEVGGYDLIVWTRNNVPEYFHDVGGDGTCIASDWFVRSAIVTTTLPLIIMTRVTRVCGSPANDLELYFMTFTHQHWSF